MSVTVRSLRTRARAGAGQWPAAEAAFPFKTEGHFAPGSMPPKGALVEIEAVAVCN